MQGLGYKELFPYLAGDCSLEEAVYIFKRDTRHFAKRQLTWFRQVEQACDLAMIHRPDSGCLRREKKILSCVREDRWNVNCKSSADAKEEEKIMDTAIAKAMYTHLAFQRKFSHLEQKIAGETKRAFCRD